MAKARSQIFEEITKKTVHQFFTLTDEIENLRKEIAVLAPSIFEKNSTEAIPSSIAALPAFAAIACSKGKVVRSTTV
tara:strand:- start:111 stop:341 length:231 start_codon:yes stop_codon:yes gene_type:complete